MRPLVDRAYRINRTWLGFHEDIKKNWPLPFVRTEWWWWWGRWRWRWWWWWLVCFCTQLSTTLPAMFQLAMTIQVLHIGNYNFAHWSWRFSPQLAPPPPPTPPSGSPPTPPEMGAIWKAKNIISKICYMVMKLFSFLQIQHFKHLFFVLFW